MHALRESGYTVDVVERWIPRCRVRKDYIGVGDLLAFSGDIVLIQATSGSNHSARVKKALAEPRLAGWLRAGGRFEVWSWRKGVSTPRVTQLVLHADGSTTVGSTRSTPSPTPE